MVFSSSTFLFVFLPITLAIYYLIPSNVRNGFLLSASLLFYFWGEPSFILVMLASILINYIFGLMLNESKTKPISTFTRRMVLFFAIFANLGLLFWFKYMDFAIATINFATGANLALLHIVLPIGISFFTFQGMTYIIDVYRRKVPVQKNPIKIALYISLFPQLIAGPIVRYKDINEQIDHRTLSSEKFAQGVARFSIGLAKKVIIANTVALVADKIFNTPVIEHTTATVWLGILCYTLQIYFDFSGYSDMAIGLGKILGFEFLENFNYPYVSKSITEFWRRWHISLSTFFRDYLYIPLGGNRTGNTYVNLLIVFLATGLWHGASWNFVVWGIWHGCFIVLEKLLRHTKLARFSIPNIFKRLYTLAVVVLGWVLFRADSLSYAFEYLKRMFGFSASQGVRFEVGYYVDNFILCVLVIAIIGSTGLASLLRDHYETKRFYSVLHMIYVLLVMIVSVIFVMTSTYNPFIYFRF